MKKITMLSIVLICVMGCAFFMFPYQKSHDQIQKNKNMQVPNTFDNLTTATCKVISGPSVVSILRDDLQKRGIEWSTHIASTIYRVDMNYIGYRKDICENALRMVPMMYDHINLIKQKVPELSGSAESSDCDNHAEWNSAWLHYMLPSCATIQIHGCRLDNATNNYVCHRYTGVVTMDGEILWKMGDPTTWNKSVGNIYFRER